MLRFGLLALAVLAMPHASLAAEADAGATANASRLEGMVHGLYVEVRAAGGYMVAQQNVPENEPFYDQLRGKPEGFGAGASMNLALGLDLTDAFAFQVVGGSALVAGTRQDRVRDLGIVFAGAGLRLSLPAGERLRFIVAGAGIYARSDDGVCAEYSNPDPEIDPVTGNDVTPPATCAAKTKSGAGALANLGLEYYVHVRHFSVGLDLSVLMPLSPSRVFVALGPQIKYTF